MNHKRYKGYRKSKEKSEQEAKEKTETLVVDINEYSRIEIIDSYGAIVKIINITGYDGVAVFS